MLVSVGGPDLFFSYQKNGEKHFCYFCGGILTRLWFLSPRCLFMATAGETILGQVDHLTIFQTQHDCCYILNLKLLKLRPNDIAKLNFFSLKFRLKSSNRLKNLLRFKREGMLSRCANRSELAVTLTSHRWLWSCAWKLLCFHSLSLFCQLHSSSACKYISVW